jgi:hypothetical protein
MFAEVIQRTEDGYATALRFTKQNVGHLVTHNFSFVKVQSDLS